MFPPASVLSRAMQRVLRDASLTADSFVQGRLPGMILREEPRALMVRPRRLSLSEPARDERFPGRHKLRISFGLPRGSYATMLIKHLFAGRSTGRAGRRGHGDHG